MSNNYMVYTRLIVNDEIKEVMISGIEAHNCCAAEHKILDIHSSIDNALAFDVSNLPDTFTAYIAKSEIISYNEFKRRYLNLVKSRQTNIDKFIDLINELTDENNEIEAHIAELNLKIMGLKNTLAVNNKYIEDTMKECAKYCTKVKMPMAHSNDDYVIGLA